MKHTLFTSIYIACVVTATAIRVIYTRQQPKSNLRATQPAADKILTTITGIGMLVIPAMYIASPWLDGFNYCIPAWLSLIGVAGVMVALWLLQQSHFVLGPHWNPTIIPDVKQEFVRNGIYQKIRHPMSAAHLLWAIVQPVILPDWIAGWAFLIASIPLYLYRIPREESLLCAHFGDEYYSYRNETGCLWPRC